jgi:hypothetical protein
MPPEPQKDEAADNKISSVRQNGDAGIIMQAQDCGGERNEDDEAEKENMYPNGFPVYVPRE